jgi:hypothetical protein
MPIEVPNSNPNNPDASSGNSNVPPQKNTDNLNNVGSSVETVLEKKVKEQQRLKKNAAEARRTGKIIHEIEVDKLKPAEELKNDLEKIRQNQQSDLIKGVAGLVDPAVDPVSAEVVLRLAGSPQLQENPYFVANLLSELDVSGNSSLSKEARAQRMALRKVLIAKTRELATDQNISRPEQEEMKDVISPEQRFKYYQDIQNSVQSENRSTDTETKKPEGKDEPDYDDNENQGESHKAGENPSSDEQNPPPGEPPNPPPDQPESDDNIPNNRHSFFDRHNPEINIDQSKFSDYRAQGKNPAMSRQYEMLMNELIRTQTLIDSNPELLNDKRFINNQMAKIAGFGAAPEEVIEHYLDKLVTRLYELNTDPDLNYRGHSLSQASNWLSNIAPLPQDLVNEATGDVTSKAELRRYLKFSEQFGHITNPMELEPLSAMFKSLYLSPETNSRYTREEIQPYLDKITESYRSMVKPDRYTLTPDIIGRLENWKTRDEEFYKVMEALLTEPNQSSRDILTLYKEAAIDNFLDAVKDIEGIGSKLGNYFTNRRHALVGFHDLDFYARSAAGDVKSFVGAMTYFQNAGMVEAQKDPLAEVMLHCVEHTLKSNMYNNNGYIQPEYVEYDPTRYGIAWEQDSLKQFEEMVRAGLVYDYARDKDGFGIKDASGRNFIRGEKLTLEDIFKKDKNGNLTKEYNLRVLATLRMAKGLGVLDSHLIEIFAFSKTPGYANPEYGTQDLVFSSKAYEGIARWFNPMADFWGKYKMPTEDVFKRFFFTLSGLDRAKINELMKSQNNDWSKIAEMAATGDFHDWVEQKYGGEIAMLADSINDFAFSGRKGPLSTWGEHDATLYFTEEMRQQEGGSIRMMRADSWAEEQVRLAWVKQEMANVHGITRSWNSEKDLTGPQALIKQKLEARWNLMKSSHDTKYHHFQKEVKASIAKHKLAYETFVWTQTIMRSPTIIAGNVRDSLSMVPIKGEMVPRYLRNVIIEQVLGINVENDIRSESSSHTSQRLLADRVAVLENDVVVVQHAALYGGVNQMPRDIILEGESNDLLNITGERGGVSEADRRKNVKQYIELVRKRMLGEKDISWWQSKLFRDPGQMFDAYGNLQLNIDGVDQLFHKTDPKKKTLLPVSAKALLTPREMLKKRPMHLGMEDVQQSVLDMIALGGRQNARRGNDFQARSDAVNAITKFLGHLRPHPDLKEFGKDFEEIYNLEQGHDPKHGKNFVKKLSEAVGRYYGQDWWAEVPGVGLLLKKVIPASLNADQYGPEHGVSWSINNKREFLGVVQQSARLDHHDMVELERRLGATRLLAILEMFVIGYAITAVLTGGVALNEGIEDEKKQVKGH